MENQSPFPDKGAEPPQFSAHVYCGQTAGWIKMSLGVEVDLGLRDIVFDVDPATPRKKGHSHSTQFLAHVYCGQMAEWMKTPLGTEVDLGAGHIVQHSTAQHSTAPALFSTHVYCGHGRPSQLLLSSCSETCWPQGNNNVDRPMCDSNDGIFAHLHIYVCILIYTVSTKKRSLSMFKMFKISKLCVITI